MVALSLGICRVKFDMNKATKASQDLKGMGSLKFTKLQLKLLKRMECWSLT